ncbi:MAG: hypothetical protein SOW59_04560 [Corynebacterium sp.]|nr:hypothetical protein [Corynebacterium sp.]
MTEKPRQYFPGEFDPEIQPPTGSYPQQGYSVPEQPVRSTSNGWAGALGAIAALALIAAGAMFFLWRSAAADANRVPPAPVTQTIRETETQTVTETTTATTTVTENFGEPAISVPPEFQDGANNVRDLIDGLLAPNSGAQGEPQPLPQ